MKRLAISVVLLLGLAIAWPSAQTAIGNFKRLIFAVDARTIASNGNGSTAATLTLTPTGSYVTLTCNDPQGCTITMGETGITDGMPVTIVCVGTYPCMFAYSSGVSELAGPAKLDPYDELDLQYVSDRWIERGRKSVYGPRSLVGSIHQSNAQIIAWPTTGDIEIVPASSGYSQVPLWGMFVCDSTSATYTNISPTDGALDITTNNNSGYGTALLEEWETASGATISALLATGTLTQVTLPMYGIVDTTTTVYSDILGLPTPAALYNGNIAIHMYNGMAGNFTGGSASNAGCDITVGYLRIKVPGL